MAAGEEPLCPEKKEPGCAKQAAVHCGDALGLGRCSVASTAASTGASMGASTVGPRRSSPPGPSPTGSHPSAQWIRAPGLTPLSRRGPPRARPLESRECPSGLVLLPPGRDVEALLGTLRPHPDLESGGREGGTSGPYSEAEARGASVHLPMVGGSWDRVWSPLGPRLSPAPLLSLAGPLTPRAPNRPLAPRAAWRNLGTEEVPSLSPLPAQA